MDAGAPFAEELNVRFQPKRLHSGDAAGGALVAGALVAGAISGSAFVLVAGVLSAIVVVMAAATGRRGIPVALGLGLIWSNALVALARATGAPTWIALAPLAILLVTVLGRGVASGRNVVVTVPFQVLLVYGAILFASSLGSPEGLSPVELMMGFFVEGLLLWFLVINVLDDRRSLERAMTALVMAGGALGAIVVVQYAQRSFGDEFVGFAQIEEGQRVLLEASSRYLPRLAGAVGEKNRFAQVLVVTLPIGLALVRRSSGSSRSLYAVASAFTLCGIALTGSRAAIFGVLVGVGVLLAVRIVDVRHVAIGVLAVAAVLVAVPSYWDRIVSASDVIENANQPSAVDSSTLSRITENVAAYRMFIDHPILGVGPGGYPPRYEQYAEFVGLNVRDGVRQPHNLYLHVAAELGAVGLFAFVTLMGLVSWRLMRASGLGRTQSIDDIAGAVLAGVAAYAATGLFLHLAFERYLWLLLAIGDAVVIVNTQERRASSLQGTPSDARPETAVKPLDSFW